MFRAFSYIFLSGLIFLTFKPLTVSADDKYPSAGNQGIIIYTLETEEKKLRHSLSWAPFNLETGLFIGLDHKNQKKNKKKLEKFRGKEVFEDKRNGKKVRKTYFQFLDPRSYVLHSVNAKGSSTTFHPETIGFEINEGEVLYLGVFSVNQKNDSFRSLIDPRIGMTLDFLGSDSADLVFDNSKLDKAGLSEIRKYIKSSPPKYVEVREYK